MPRKPDVDERWYEAQRIANYVPGQADGEWIEWESFPYDHEAFRKGPIRLAARTAAMRAAKECYLKHGWPVRVVHIQQVFMMDDRDA